jgi:hypothetical protein
MTVMRPPTQHLFVTAKLLFAGAGVTALIWICLSGCASSGFYQMSDNWCMQHPAASSARCQRKPSDVVLIGQASGN